MQFQELKARKIQSASLSSMEATEEKITISVMDRRISIFIASSIYAISLLYFIEFYVAIEWRMYGFTFSTPALWEWLAMFTSLSFISYFLPTCINRPSALILVVIHYFVFVPAIVMLIGMDRGQGPLENDFQLFLALTIGFCLSNFFAQQRSWSTGDRSPKLHFVPALIVIWLVALVLLIYLYRSVMSFASLNTIYEQRKAGAAQTFLEGYLQVYFGYVISPALLAFGLARRSVILIGMGVLGSMVLFAITAEKAVFTYPFLMIAMYCVLVSKMRALLNTSSIGIVFTLTVFLSGVYYNVSALAGFVGWYVGVRSLVFPGAVIVFYNDFFEANGHTYGTQIAGVGHFIETPEIYASHRRWPSLGHIIGEDHMHIPSMNASANFIASDGAASLGPLGVFLVLMILLPTLLYCLDKYSRGLPKAFVLTALVPIALTLTNLSIFTTLTSFGGFVTLLALRFGFTKWRS